MFSSKFIINIMIGFVLTVFGIFTLNSPIILDNLVGIVLFLGGFVKMGITVFEDLGPSVPKKAHSK